MNPQNEQSNNEPVEPFITRKDLFMSGNFFTLPHKVLEDEKFKKYPANTKVLYMYMAKLSNLYFGKNNGWFWRSCKTLAIDTGSCVKTVFNGKIRMLKDGFLEREKGKYNPDTNTRGPDRYRVRGSDILPKLEPLVDDEVKQENQQAIIEESLENCYEYKEA